MKNIIIALFISFQAMGQSSVGIKTSANMSTMSKFPLIENIIPAFKLAPSVGGGVFFDIPISASISFQPELNFVQKGFKVNKAIDIASDKIGIDFPLSASAKMKLRYIQTPLLVKINLKHNETGKIYLLAGPSIGYLNSTVLRINVFNVIPIQTGFPKARYKDFELSGIVALGSERSVNEKVSLLAEARYEAGLSRIVNTPIVNIPVRNSTYSGSLGLKIKI